MCVYMCCADLTLLSKLESDSLYSVLCEILPFIFPLRSKSKVEHNFLRSFSQKKKGKRKHSDLIVCEDELKFNKKLRQLNASNRCSVVD